MQCKFLHFKELAEEKKEIVDIYFSFLCNMRLWTFFLQNAHNPQFNQNPFSMFGMVILCLKTKNVTELKMVLTNLFHSRAFLVLHI